MSVNENLHKVDSMFEAFNAQDWDRYYELFAESVVTHSVGVPEPIKGRAALREGDEGYLTAFPDLRVKKEHSFGQGDWDSPYPESISRRSGKKSVEDDHEKDSTALVVNRFRT